MPCLAHCDCKHSPKQQAVSRLDIVSCFYYSVSMKISKFLNHRQSVLSLISLLAVLPSLSFSQSAASLPIADAHVHYSHDSVELTPPARVIELMRSANLKFALVSSSDDNGTQLLSEIAPDLIVPGLRPYRRRGETGTWFNDPAALIYVEDLLSKNRYASIGEFHLYGDAADLPIPRRIVKLAEEHNLILHAHSDADAVSRLLAQSDKVKVIWAHSGFDDPGDISDMLSRHDRLWADLAFRGEVGSGGQLSQEWQSLFEAHPDRLMLGTDTYTPERMYYIPDHADSARVWLSKLPQDLAERIAWKNAHDLIMPVWRKNQATETHIECIKQAEDDVLLEGDNFVVLISPDKSIAVSEEFSAHVAICGDGSNDVELSVNATMPAHGHGMNYQPRVTKIAATEQASSFAIEGLLLHMPGDWQWSLTLRSPDKSITLERSFELR